MVEVVDVARAHEHAWLRRQATTVAPIEVDGDTVGEVVLTASVPRIRDHNAVVLGPCPALDGHAVAALVDDELGRHGVAHRRLYADPADADRWESALTARGHERSDTMVMVWPGASVLDPGPAGIEVVEADRTTTADAVRTVLGADPGGEPEVLDQLVALATAQHDLGARVFVARVDGRTAGAVRLFPGDGVAQIEELQVVPGARGHGVGRALLAAGLDAAHGQDLVFLTSDPDDWPTTWYSRLGFRTAGRSSGFVREAVEGAA